MNRIKQAIFSLLITVMSFYCMMTEDYKHVFAMVITILVSFITAWFLYPRIREYTFEYYRQHYVLAGGAFVWAELTAYEMLVQKAALAQEKCTILPDALFRWWDYGMAGIGIWIVYLVLVRFLIELFSYIWMHVADRVRFEYKVLSIALGVAVFLMYIFFPGWFSSMDRIYSADSVTLIGSLYGHPEYLEVHHSLYSLITFPICAVLQIIGRFILPAQIGTIFFVVMVQLFCVQSLLWTGLLLHCMTKHAYVFRLYCVTNAVFFYFFALEKYQIPTFLVVLYIYLRTEERRGSDTTLVMVGGTMLTSLWAGWLEIIGSGTVVDKIKRIGKLILWGCVLMIVSGHIRFFYSEYINLFIYKKAFAFDVPIIGRIQSVFWMIQSAFVPIAATGEGGYITWRTVTEGWSIVGIIFFAIMLLGFVKNYKSIVRQMAMIWTVFAFVLFVPLNWSVVESPLFNILFLWAFLLLFVDGVDVIIQKLRIKAKIAYGVLTALCFALSSLNILFVLHSM